MVDKKEIKELAASLYFDIDDKLVQKIVDYLNDATKKFDKFVNLVEKDFEPANYPKVKSCSTLRKDVPEKKEGDYLSNTKTADKYVIGK